MPREILGEVVNQPGKAGTRKWHTVPLSIAGHVLVLGAALIGAPSVPGDTLPLPPGVRIFVTPEPPGTPPTPRPPVPAVNARRETDSVPDIVKEAAPIQAPATLGPEPEPRRLGGSSVIDPGALLIGTAPSVEIASPPASPLPVTPMRAGGVIQAPRLLKRVDPIYPTIARSARLQGSVTVEATIARDGSVKDVRRMKSTQPLFDKAALDAVAQWKYSPTTLNGEAVEVLLSVEVTFTLR